MSGKTLCLIRASLFDELRWYTAPDFMRTYFRVGKNQRSSRNYSAFTYIRTIKHGAAHTYKASFTERAGMHCSVMTDGDIILKDGRTGGIGHMNHCSILHITAVSHRDRCHIAPHNSVKPH